MSTRVIMAVVALAVATLGTGCTASGPRGPSGIADPTSTRTVTSTAPPVSTGPLPGSPVRSAGGTCRLAGTSVVRSAVGMRLARVTVQTAAGKPVGCRFYALQGSPLSHSERLPGPHQPVVELRLIRYASVVAARNAMVRTAEAGTNVQRLDLGAGRVGLAYQTDFYPIDRGKDWACAVNSGARLLIVRTVVLSPAEDVIPIVRAVLARI